MSDVPGANSDNPFDENEDRDDLSAKEEFDRNLFVDRVVSFVRGRFPLVKIGRAEKPFAVTINGQTAALENVWRLTRLRPAEEQRRLERWIVEMLRAGEGSPDLEKTFEDLKSRVMPMIVPDSMGLVSVTAHQPLVEGLSVGYAIDNDRSISYISQSRLGHMAVDLDTLHETSLQNLVSRSQNLQGHAAQDESGKVFLIIFQTMDGYDASRILLPGLHDRLREHLGSPFAAAIPNRDILLCFRDDAETVGRLTPQIHSDYSQMPNQITSQLLLLTADGIALRQDLPA